MQKVDSFKNRLNYAMEERGINQITLGRLSKIERSSISKWMSGVHEPKTDSIYKLSIVLNVSPTWLMGYDVSMNKKVSKTDETIVINLKECDFLKNTTESNIVELLKKYSKLTKEQRTIINSMMDQLINTNK